MSIKLLKRSRARAHRFHFVSDALPDDHRMVILVDMKHNRCWSARCEYNSVSHRTIWYNDQRGSMTVGPDYVWTDLPRLEEMPL